MRNNLIKFVDDFKNRKIVVIGDIMLDKYVWGAVHRISQEAPVQIVDVEHESFVPGGAGNSASNIASFNAKVFLVGVVGSDSSKDILEKELLNRNIIPELVVDKLRPTIVKERIMGRNQQILRIDYEKRDFYSKEIKQKFMKSLMKVIPDCDAVIISDYAKGINDPELIPEIISFCQKHNKITIADFKSKNHLIYRNISLITPNKHDSKDILHMDAGTDEEVIAVCKKFSSDLNCDVLMTRGSQGMSAYTKDNSFATIPSIAREVFDTTGAGDTVTAVVALALASGASLKQAAELATAAAGVVVAKVGTATCNVDELRAALAEMKFE